MANIYDYIEAGFPVFGLYGITKDGKCECGNPDCEALFKHPRVSNWQHTPIWSDDQLELQEQMGYFKTGFGVLTTGRLIVDIDERNGGYESFGKLCKDLNADLLGDCGFAVRTGSGGNSMHLYFSLPDGDHALVQGLPAYPGIDFKTTGYVVGCGSMHKSGGQYEKIHGHPDDITQAPDALLQLLRKPDHFRGTVHGESLDVSDAELREIVSYLPADCDYETWYKAGMAIHHVTHGAGFDIWDAWSNQGEKYPGRAELDKKWHSFGKSGNPVKLGTLIHYAEQYGYRQPVTFTPTITTPKGDHPFPIDTVDLLRPPGFVGEVAKWIDAQCRYPRENLAVAAALSAIGNICGLRYTDDLSGVTANLFVFCVAGSSTGKEAVQQAQAAIHRAAGISGATHGSIKSEQEIIRNLIRHQAANYIIDEIGILLHKIVNAQKRGGAVYLDGVIGLLMSAYSKADGFMLLTGDTKEDVRKALAGELAQVKNMLAENEGNRDYNNARSAQITKALDNLDRGLERPFLSLIGYTTPETFTDIVNHEQATNGFIGRSVIITEKETNPRARRGYRRQAMSSQMEAALQNLYAPGVYDSHASRVEYYGDRIKIGTEPAAVEMMDAVLDWIEDYAEKHKSMTGLEAVVRRGYELMAKISLILAAPEGVRTTEHVRWAYALMRRDIDEKIMLAHGNESSSHNEAIAARIRSIVDSEHGEPESVILRRCKKWDKEEVRNVVAKLVEMGHIKEVEQKHPLTGVVAKKYFAC